MNSGEAAPHLSISLQQLQLVAWLEPPIPEASPTDEHVVSGGWETPARLMEIQGPGATAASIIFDPKLASAKIGQQGKTMYALVACLYFLYQNLFIVMESRMNPDARFATLVPT